MILSKKMMSGKKIEPQPEEELNELFLFEDKFNLFYSLINNEFYPNYHKLIGPAIIPKIQGIYGKYYFINNCLYVANEAQLFYIKNIFYMLFLKNKKCDSATIFIHQFIIKLIPQYNRFIKQNIKNLTKQFDVSIILYNTFEKNAINQLPNFIKDLLIL